MKATLNLTHRCNLSCRYCYAGRKSQKDMSIVTAKKVIDFAMDVAAQARTVSFGFAGGEPLLCFELMKNVISYIREKEHKAKKRILLSVTTNGTLVADAILDYFRKEGIGLCISIDGPAHVHNLNRCYQNGQGSFEDVVKNLRRAMERLGSLQVNAVFGPDTIDYLPESVSFFAELGVSAIHLNPNICSSYEETIYPKLRKVYMQIADHYIQSYQHGQEIAVNLIDGKIIVFLKG